MKKTFCIIKKILDHILSSGPILLLITFFTGWYIFSEQTVGDLLLELLAVAVLIGFCEFIAFLYRKFFKKEEEEKDFLSEKEVKADKLNNFELLKVYKTDEGIAMRGVLDINQRIAIIESLFDSFQDDKKRAIKKIIIDLLKTPEKTPEKEEQEKHIIKVSIQTVGGEMKHLGMVKPQDLTCLWDDDEDEKEEEERTCKSYPQEINDIIRAGYKVIQIQPWQYRVNESVDIFPKSSKYHILKQLELTAPARGKFKGTALEFVNKFFK